MPRSIFNAPPFRSAHNAGWNLPREVTALPMTLKRTQLYPRNPGLTQAGINEYNEMLADDVQPAHLLPGRMLYQRHKESPATQDPLAPATSVIDAQWPDEGSRAVIRGPAQLPSFAQGQTAAATAQTNGWVNMPSINWALDKTDRPLVAKNIPRNDRTGLPAQIQDAMVSRQEMELDARGQQDAARQVAIAQTQAVRAGLAGIALGTTDAPVESPPFVSPDLPSKLDPDTQTFKGLSMGVLAVGALAVGGTLWLGWKLLSPRKRRYS